jgi:hypothetical protein
MTSAAETEADKAKSLAIYILGLGAAVIGAVPQVDVGSGWVHGAMVIGGSIIVAVERYIQTH